MCFLFPSLCKQMLTEDLAQVFLHVFLAAVGGGPIPHAFRSGFYDSCITRTTQPSGTHHDLLLLHRNRQKLLTGKQDNTILCIGTRILK